MLAGVTIRTTRADDLRGAYRVFRLAIVDLYARHGFTPPDPPEEVWRSQQEHLLAHDAERCFVAEEEGEVVAFVSSWARGDAWFLASLFVAPEFQARGLGRALLERAWGDHARRQTLTDAIQPVSNGLYGRLGLIPFTPLLSLAGEPRIDAPHELEPADAEVAALRDLDLASYGFDRGLDHAYWASHGSTLTLWRRDGDPVAYSYAWPHGQIGPVAGADADAAAAALRGELARAVGRISVRAPGSAAPLVHAALTAGLRITGPPGLLLCSRDARRPDALAISSYTLL